MHKILEYAQHSDSQIKNSPIHSEGRLGKFYTCQSFLLYGSSNTENVAFCIVYTCI